MARLTQDRRAHQRMSVIWQGMITSADLRVRCRVLCPKLGSQGQPASQNQDREE